MNSYYEILGVTKQSTKEEIKRKYKELMKQHHPDRFVNDPIEVQNENNKITQYINEAYDTLSNDEKKKKYDMKLERDEKQEKQRYEEEQKRKEEQKRREEKERKQREEQKRSEEEQKRREEQQRREKEAQKRREEEQRLTYIYNELKKSKTFSEKNISLEKFIDASYKDNYYLNIYDIANRIYESKEKLISNYFRRPKTSFIKSKELDKEHKQEDKEYKNRINNEFSTIDSSIDTVLKYMEEYNFIELVCGPTTWDEVYNYIIKDKKHQKIQIDSAMQKLNNYYSYSKLFISEEEKNEYFKLQDKKYISKMLRTKNIYNVLISNFEFRKSYQSMEIEKLFQNMKKAYPNAAESFDNLNIYVNYLYNMKDEIYSKMKITQLNPENDFNFKNQESVTSEISRIIQMSEMFNDISEIYELSKIKNITEIYNFYKVQLKEGDTRLDKKIKEGLKETIRIFKDFEVINEFNRQYSKETLAKLSNEDYERLIEETNEEILKYKAMLNENANIKEYFNVFKKNRELFQGKFSEVVGQIAPKVENIKKLHLSEKIEDLFSLTDEELYKKCKKAEKKQKIYFIMTYDDVYKRVTGSSNQEEFFEFMNKNSNLEIELDIMPERQFEEIYMRNYLKYVNQNSSKYKENNMSKEQYLDLSEDIRKKELKDAMEEHHLRSLVETINKKRKSRNRKEITYEELKSMASMDIFNLDVEAFSYNISEKRKEDSYKEESSVK